MSNPSGYKSLTLILLSILFYSVSILSWYLLDQISAFDDALPTTLILIIRLALALAMLSVSVQLWKEVKTPFKDHSNHKKIEKIIENAITDHQQIRSAIIRLKQIVDPTQMKLAVGISTLLNQLLTTLESLGTEHKAQKKENVTLSKTASDLKVKHDQLVNAPQLRSEFLSRMGDEITLPLESLGTMLKLLKTMELDSETRDILSIATHSAHSLIENLSNILEFSKLNAHLRKLDNSQFNLSETISSLLETQESIALSKSLFIETHIKPDVPEMITTDIKALVKVLDNLISNAIRFTERGDIRLEVDAHTSGDKTLLRFTVIDTGIGIPESALSSLFESLDKNTDLINSSFTGRLRLIVSKQLCEIMGGKIGVRSKQGIGSQFWFTIDISS